MSKATTRPLTPAEIEQLERQGNCAEDWSALRVTDPFCPECIRNSTFMGAVSLGSIERRRRTDGALVLPEGVAIEAPNLVAVPFAPTTENLLLHFARLLEPVMPAGARLHSLRLAETDTSVAELIL